MSSFFWRLEKHQRRRVCAKQSIRAWNRLLAPNMSQNSQIVGSIIQWLRSGTGIRRENVSAAPQVWAAVSGFDLQVSSHFIEFWDLW